MLIDEHPLLKIILDDIGAEVTACGSRVTCNPPPTDTDEDWLVLANQDRISMLISVLTEEGWNWEGSSEHYQNLAANSFMSWRKDKANLIITASKDFATRHKLATSHCKLNNVMDKQERIKIFQAYLYGNDPDGILSESSKSQTHKRGDL